MAGGFGEAAAAVSFISLTIQLFDGCVKGFTLLSNAQGFGSQAEILVCQLEWEHYRFSQWARMVGLCNDVPELNIANQDLVQRTLVSLKQLLSNTDALSSDYGLDLKVTDEEIEELPVSSRHFLGKVIDRLKPEFLSDAAKVYQRRNHAWNKLKWSSIDATKFRMLLKDIRYFNKQLGSLLHSADQCQNIHAQDQLMRTAVARTADRKSIDMIRDSVADSTIDTTIVSSAKLRQKGLYLDLIGPPSPPLTPVSTSPPLNQYRDSFSRSSKLAGMGFQSSKAMRKDLSELSCHGHRNQEIVREVAIFKGKAVVLEWKDVPPHLDPKLKHRISNLASFLAEISDPAFNSLVCLGYVRVSSSYCSSPTYIKGWRYAYLFEPPRAMGMADRLTTLSDMLQGPKQDIRQGVSRWLSAPGINIRTYIALSLAETLLHLHTTGWLHKAIRPDNILFFHGDDNHKDNHKDGHSSKYQRQQRYWKPYLCGYTSARADTPLETTEEPSDADLTELYRHPLSLGHGRIPYRQAFDRHSLGCVLIEIGLWSSLPDLLRTYLVKDPETNILRQTDAVSPATQATIDSSRHDALLLAHKVELLSGPARWEGEGILAELEHAMGTAYTDVVQQCLQDDHLLQSRHTSGTSKAGQNYKMENVANGDEEEDPILETHRSLRMQQEFVDILRELNRAL